MLNFDMKLHSRWSFVTGFFPKHVFKVHPCYSMHKYFMLSYRQITFHCIDMPHFTSDTQIISIFLANVTSAAIIVYIHIFA